MIAILYRVISSLAALAFTIVILAFVVDSTLMTAKYIDSQAVKAGTYKALADNLNKQIDEKAPGSGIFLAEESVKEPLQTFLVGLEKFYRGQGPAPVLGLTSIGIPAAVLPPDFSETLPFTQPANATKIQFFYAQVAWTKTVGLGIVLALLALSVWLGHLAGHTHALGRFAFKATLFWGLSYLAIGIAPGLLTSSLSQEPDPVLPSFAAMFKSAFGDMSSLSLKVWLALAGATVAIFLGSKIMQIFGRMGGHGGTAALRRREKFHPPK